MDCHAFDINQRRAIADRYVAGESSAKLAEEFFYTNATVLKYVKQFHPKYDCQARMGHVKPVDVDQVLTIWGMVGEGLNQNQIAKELRISWKTVKSAMSAMRIVRALSKPVKPRTEPVPLGGVWKMYKCPSCGMEVDRWDRFCRGCGQALEVE